MEKIKNLITYIDKSKWIKAILLIGMGIYILYMVYQMQNISVKNGYETITQKSIIAFVLALMIYALSLFKENKFTKHLKNIMSIVLASLSIYVVMQLKFQMYDFELRLSNIEKILLVDNKVY